jgi:hypothetical protein
MIMDDTLIRSCAMAGVLNVPISCNVSVSTSSPFQGKAINLFEKDNMVTNIAD